MVHQLNIHRKNTLQNVIFKQCTVVWLGLTTYLKIILRKSELPVLSSSVNATEVPEFSSIFGVNLSKCPISLIYQKFKSDLFINLLFINIYIILYFERTNDDSMFYCFYFTSYLWTRPETGLNCVSLNAIMIIILLIIGLIMTCK